MWVMFRGMNLKMAVQTLITLFSRVKKVFRLAHLTLFELSLYRVGHEKVARLQFCTFP